ncbi:MAG: CBS domain-containing protein [Flavisolibacter sp.]|nr:CBS domain-containing protein [Flavisolibacter sp.]
MQTVRDIIEAKAKSNNFITPDIMVIDALKKLLEVNLSYLVVIDDGAFKGIFSERDYTRKLVLQGRSSRETTVGQVMTTDLPVVSLTETVEECMYRMNGHGTRYLLALDDNKFAGIITIHDLLRQVIATKGEVFNNSLARELLDNDESGLVY